MVAFAMTEEKPKDPRLVAMGDRIKARREYLGFSQEQMAIKMGMKRATYAHWEQGRTEISALELQALAKALRTHTSYFLEEDAEVAQTEIVAALNELPDTLSDPIENLIRETHRNYLKSQTTHGPKAE